MTIQDETTALRLLFAEASLRLDTIDALAGGTPTPPNFELNFLIAGQSNAVSAFGAGDTHVMASAADRCWVGVVSADGLSVTHSDAFATQMESGLAWIHMANKLRTYAGKDKRYGLTICAEGNTTVQQWASEPRLTRLKNALGTLDIDGVIWLQGESNGELGFNQSVQDAMATIITQCNAVKTVPWIINLCDHPYDNTGYYSIALAQQYVVDAYANTYWGIDASRMHCPYVLPNTVNRANDEVHFVGARKQVQGEVAADRIVDVYGLWYQ